MRETHSEAIGWIKGGEHGMWIFTAYLNGKPCYSLHHFGMNWQMMLMQVRARFGAGVADSVEAAGQKPGRLPPSDDGMSYAWDMKGGEDDGCRA
jgi:hypothetical protein